MLQGNIRNAQVRVHIVGMFGDDLAVFLNRFGILAGIYPRLGNTVFGNDLRAVIGRTVKGEEILADFSEEREADDEKGYNSKAGDNSHRNECRAGATYEIHDDSVAVYGNRNNRRAFPVVARATSSMDTPFTCASTSAINGTYDASFGLPR